jgi:hypothetical protein
MPSSRQRPVPSTECCDENCDGMAMPVTCSGPRASAAMAAVARVDAAGEAEHDVGEAALRT